MKYEDNDSILTFAYFNLFSFEIQLIVYDVESLVSYVL